MKIVTLILGCIALSTVGFGQEELSKKIPPMALLPTNGEAKTFYELPDSADYKIFDVKGKLVQSGHAEFIDITDFEEGTYFINYGGKNYSFIRSKTEK